MSVTLQQGLKDLSYELGETSVNTTEPRVAKYGEAIVQFFNEHKWKFATKENASITTTTSKTYDISDITDMRDPGGIKSIEINGAEYLPIPFEKRFDSRYNSKNFFYHDIDLQTITFTSEMTAGYPIKIRYWFIPERTTDVTLGTYPLPDRYRKAVSLLASAYVQQARYLDAQASSKFVLYEREIKKLIGQQSERHTGMNRSFGNFLNHIGFRRR